MKKASIEALKRACEKRAIACECFANKPGTCEKDALLYRGQAQAFRECAELIGMILK